MCICPVVTHRPPSLQPYHTAFHCAKSQLGCPHGIHEQVAHIKSEPQAHSLQPDLGKLHLCGMKCAQIARTKAPCKHGHDNSLLRSGKNIRNTGYDQA